MPPPPPPCADDIAKDTSDTDRSENHNRFAIEYDVVSLGEVEQARFLGDTSCSGHDCDTVSIFAVSSSGKEFADDSDVSSSKDSESLNKILNRSPRYPKCTQCKNDNNNKMLRYCERCYKFRKEIFPPRPRRKLKHATKIKTHSQSTEVPREKFDKDNLSVIDSGLCMMCLLQPKTGVFAHGRIAHICCCYKCAMKIWRSTKRCPLCNCRVSNVLKGFVR